MRKSIYWAVFEGQYITQWDFESRWFKEGFLIHAIFPNKKEAENFILNWDGCHEIKLTVKKITITL